MVVVRTNKTHYPPQDIVASSSFGWHTNQRLGNPWRKVQFRGRDEAYLEDSFPRRGKNDEGRPRCLPRRARPTLTTRLDSSSRHPLLPPLLTQLEGEDQQTLVNERTNKEEEKGKKESATNFSSFAKRKMRIVAISRLTSPASPDEPQIVELGHLVLHEGGRVPQLGAAILVVARANGDQRAVPDLAESDHLERDREGLVRPPMGR